MIKFILHGGYTREINPDNDSFFREITLGLRGRVTVLLNYFSREENETEECSHQDKKRFLENSENKDLNFEISEPETFAQQLEKSQVLYVRGGDTEKLIAKISQNPNISQYLKDKVVGGSSAGVYVWCKYFWENDDRKIGKGIGTLNFKALCHYRPEDDQVVKRLLDFKEKLPLLVLPNFKWQVFFTP